MTNLQKVLEERVLDNHIELTLREVLGIAKREFHNIVDLVKRKRLTTEPEPEKPAEVRAALLDEMAVEDELAESHYAKPHCYPVRDVRRFKCDEQGSKFIMMLLCMGHTCNCESIHM